MKVNFIQNLSRCMLCYYHEDRELANRMFCSYQAYTCDSVKDFVFLCISEHLVIYKQRVNCCKSITLMTALTVT